MLRLARAVAAASAAATLVTLLPPSLLAQGRPDSAARQDSTRALEEVRVRAAYTPRVVGSASSITLTPDSLPIGITAPTMGEALRRMPFVYIRQNSRGETELSVRGSESRQAAVFLEGVPLTLTWDARTDVGIVPLAGVQHLDYVRGLSSLLAGPNAIGGVVSARLWSDHDPYAPPERLARAEVTGDQFGGVRTSAAVGGALQHSATSTIQVRAGAGWRDLPGLARPRAVDEPQGNSSLRLNTDARTYDVFAGARYEHAQGRYLSGFISALEGSRGVAPELHVNDPRLWRNPDVSRRVASISAGTGGLHSRLGVGDVEIAVSSNQGFVEINSFADRDYRSVVATELGDDRTTSLRLTFDQELGRRAVLRGSYTDANVRYLETIGTTAPTRYAQRLTSAAAEIDLTPTRFLTLTAGLANDAAETTDAGGREPLGRKDGLGWRLGATWLLPMQGLRLHASASERRRFPALRELYSGALGRFAPNPELRPETAHSTEVGVTFLRGAFDAQAVAFSQRIDDAVVRVTLPDRRFQRLNRDRFTSSGLELTTGAILGGTTLRADLTAQRARIADVSVTNPAFLAPEDVPAVFGSLLATRSLTQGVDVMGRVRVLGDTKCTNPNTSTLDTQRGTQTVDLGLERRWTRNSWMRRVRASVQVENVLDRALYDKCGLPQAGRTARVGFTLG